MAASPPMLIISREAGHVGSYHLGELLAARGVAVLFEFIPSVCDPPLAIEDALRSALEHCSTCRDRATGAASPQTRLLPKQLACRNATCVPSPLKRCVAAAMINGVGAALSAPRHIPRVHLTRTNVVKHALSQLSLWPNHVTGAASVPFSARLPKRVNVTHLIGMIERTERNRKMQANYLRGSAFYVSYEGLQIEPQVELDAIFRAMKLSPTPPAVSLEGNVRKTTSDDLRSSVQNFEEVAQALRERGQCYHDMWVAAEPREFQACQ
jgi:hypothetical protein